MNKFNNASIPRLLIPISNGIARVLGKLATWLDDTSLHLDRCRVCGRSTFYGSPCK